jgi:hypothetical protein
MISRPNDQEFSTCFWMVLGNRSEAANARANGGSRRGGTAGSHRDAAISAAGRTLYDQTDVDILGSTSHGEDMSTHRIKTATVIISFIFFASLPAETNAQMQSGGGKAVDGISVACSKWATPLLRSMQDAPNGNWKSTLSAQLSQIQSRGFVDFVREHGGPSQTLEYIGHLVASTGQNNPYDLMFGNSLAQVWTGLLHCMANDISGQCAAPADGALAATMVPELWPPILSEGLRAYIQQNGGISGSREHMAKLFASEAPNPYNALGRWNQLFDCMASFQAPEGPCFAPASRVLELIQNPPNLIWTRALITPLQQIRTKGLNAYIRDYGISKLMVSTQADLAEIKRSDGGDTYGISLNQAFIELLVCMSGHP